MTSTSAVNKKIIEPTAIRVWTEKRTIFIELTDGRLIGFPADRFKILSKATDEELKYPVRDFPMFPPPARMQTWPRVS